MENVKELFVEDILCSVVSANAPSLVGSSTSGSSSSFGLAKLICRVSVEEANIHEKMKQSRALLVLVARARAASLAHCSINHLIGLNLFSKDWKKLEATHKKKNKM